ncbi:plasmid pRiA4b ORF-3 family protein [Nodosilinea nodulosa]|uniref:plasmid pRiA4b ORF-3 family protein n=1 Tax=Nodosilinea nodulosa TaxID=416001 RepID=UPI0002D4D53E|nr:plasmid pRiA4b ORF-3 family protein [Nodosilinea nodulosa]
MAAMPTSETYHLHIELLDSDPPIWRQVCVQGDRSLEDLHQILAAAVGWSGQADYVFKGQGQVLASGEDRSLATLLAQPGDALIYIYAPALGWLHKITLEAIAPAQHPLPHCTAGERQCPPEFCNGVWDYVDLLDRLSDSDDPEEVDALWQKVGYDFDPEHFDRASANQRLQSLVQD